MLVVSGILGFGVNEPGIPLTIESQNPCFKAWNPLTRIRYLESKTVLNFLTWGEKKQIARKTSNFIGSP